MLKKFKFRFKYRKIVNGGTIKIESDLSKGSSFIFTVPLNDSLGT